MPNITYLKVKNFHLSEEPSFTFLDIKPQLRKKPDQNIDNAPGRIGKKPR
jgi:hypothetical protein